MTSIQMLAINALPHNVSNFAQETVRSPATEEFKANPTKDTMMDYLFNSILMRRRTVERRTSLYDRSRLADRDTLPQATTSSRSNFRTRPPVSLAGPEEEEPEQPTRPSRPRLGGMLANSQPLLSRSRRKSTRMRTKGVRLPRHRIRITEACHRDLLVWLQFLRDFNGRTFFLDEPWQVSPPLKLYMDAAGSKGYGALFGKHWFYREWPAN